VDNHKLKTEPRARGALLWPLAIGAALCLAAAGATNVASSMATSTNAATATNKAAVANKLVVASWNVENLFDWLDDPDNEGDDEFTPRGPRYWTYPRYRQKLTNLAEVISIMRPDILCLQEIENRKVLNDLCYVLDTGFNWKMPVIVHREGGDPRGIDVAILARHEPQQTKWLQPSLGRRDQTMVTFELAGRPLTIICHHWKSQYGDAEESLKARTAEAQHLATQVQKMLKRDPTAAIIATGDFNDQCDNPVLVNEAGLKLWPQTPATAASKHLFNLAGILPKGERGTYYYSKNRVWNSFDSISVSPGMLPEARSPAAWLVLTNTYGRYIANVQTNKAGYPLSYWRALRSETGRRKVGYSDHFPVYVELASHAPATSTADSTKEPWSRRLWRRLKSPFRSTSPSD